MSNTNGTMIDETEEVGAEVGAEVRVGKAKRKTKAAPKSKFKEGFEFLRDGEGKGTVTLTRKTEEGTLSLSINGFPEDNSVEAVQQLAAEVGLKGAAKSSTGEAVSNFQKSLKEEEAEAFVGIVCN